MKEKATITELLIKGEKQSSGYITEATRFTFRTKSADIVLLFQMSREMWEFSYTGDLFFETAINRFLYELFSQWMSRSHSIKIIFFSRTHYDKV